MIQLEAKNKQKNTKFESYGLEKLDATTSLVWSSLVFILNVYTLFSVILWFSVDGLPIGNALYFEILVEILLLGEIILRICFKFYNKVLFSNINLYHSDKSDSSWRVWMVLIASITQLTFFNFFNNFFTMDKYERLYSYLLAIKLLRSFEIVRYIERIQEKLFYRTTKALIFINLVYNVGLAILITHMASNAFLFIEKTHPHSHGPESHSKNPLNPFREGIKSKI